MRFRYFDESGSEVEVSSVDALAFRIRTGAVGPETLLYDSAVDEWGPAGEHAVFRFVTDEDAPDPEEEPATPEEVAPPGEAAPRNEPGPKKEPHAEGAQAPEPQAPETPAAAPPSQASPPEAEPPDEHPGEEESPEAPAAEVEIPAALLTEHGPSVSAEAQDAPGPGDGRRFPWGRVVGGAAVALALSIGLLLGRNAGDEMETAAGPAQEPAPNVDRAAPTGAAGAAGAGSASEAPPPGPPPELVAEVTGAAAGDLAVALLDLQAALEVPERPPEIWLEGAYFADAGAYPGVARYWEGFGRSISVVRSLEGRLFRGSVTRHVERAELGPGASDALEARVLERFAAAAEKRAVLYDDLEALAEEALALHALLVENSDAIDHAPFTPGGVSRDPVLEAVPDDPELAEALWGRLDRIFEILERLQGVGPVSTPRLTEALMEGILPPGGA